jgi:hypothetical protein
MEGPMPLASTSSPLRWLLPIGALALGAMVLIPSAPDSDRPSVALISPAEAAINARLAPAPVVRAVALAPVPAANAEDKPAALVALASPPVEPDAAKRPLTPKVDEEAAVPVVEPDIEAPRLMARTGLNLRSAPSTNSPRLDVLKPHQQVAVVEVSGNWTRIRTDEGTEGWAYSPLLADPSETVIVASSPRTETVASVSRGEVTYEPTRRRTTLFDYLDDEGLISR